MNTKQIEIIAINDSTFQEIVSKTITEIAKEEIEKIAETWRSLQKPISKLLENSWIRMKNKAVFYNHDVPGLFPDFNKFELGHCSTGYRYDNDTFNNKFSGFTGKLLSERELQSAFLGKFENLKRKFGWKFKTDCCYTVLGNSALHANGNNKYKFGNYDYHTSYHIPIFRLSEKITHTSSVWEVILQWLKYDLIPDGLTKEEERAYLTIQSLNKTNSNYFLINDGLLKCNNNLLMQDMINQTLKLQSGKSLTATDVASTLKTSMPIDLPSGSLAVIKDKLLNCDYERCDLESYDERILTDPNRGHWDLWQVNDTMPYTARVNEVLMARNPVADINYDGVVGIDFGTKSTVVVYQESSDHTMPMRIGTGRFSQKVEDHHYENPTVLEFLDLDAFMAQYNQAEGRPHTLWENLTTSHTAFSSLLNSSSDEYYAYLYELKQWAGDSKRYIRLRDKQGKDMVLPAFLTIEAEQFNPIELYAYFIGLYINNMHNGIYLDYLLSFPVTYEKAVRQKIVDSFSRGLKKSLPASLLEDEKVMEQFRVLAGASEPAAYAICALQEYGFSPEGDEKVFYSVFDFGGGTTDFDFGLFREADASERRYDYVMECFGAGGDQYLGGENLLELLAFEVFKANQDAMRSHGLTFTLPPECNRFPGSEVLINESQEARLNTTQLMEKLRPLWESHSEYEKAFESGIIKVNLFDAKGNAKLNFELSVDPETLHKILRDRIEKGVRNFFASLRLAFKVPATKDITLINIFLAGNSSKSALVRELFEQYTRQITKEICGEEDEQQFFSIFPPLGSVEALEIQRNLQVESSTTPVRPTGKTGVAFGLVESRPGGRIKIVQQNESKVDNEIKFKYYIGIEKRKKFICLSDRELAYGEWQELIDAGIEDFTLYYTNLPEAYKNNLKIDQVSRKKCRINGSYPDANIYYRAVKPTVIEYVVARPGELEQEKYLEPVIQLDLA
ncbi:hypothetical protein F9B85_00855 [Heliorestis acidaminivorans]|uniref:Molecular chaperone DnaK n=1 Tax=Heliorestis acidaminivorans TaxID=553427 RepID=A0A6I0F028_9FIRM|nr:hypothetical protein [Heliorestis acidaminivorans]KAB2954276.1 hypothetical protein F9B85_00855 [Heliorestis acidaminivorans]